MKTKRYFLLFFVIFSVCCLWQQKPVEAADVYQVDRYGELYNYSGNPSVVIRSNTSAVRSDAFSGVRTMRFSVSSGNPYFKSVNGVLYSRDGSILIKCPTEKKGAFTIPSAVRKIADRAFENCGGLTRVTIPNSVTTMGEYCFKNCGMLKSVKLSEGVEKIRQSTFFGCSSLNNITIPASVKVIEERAFYRCQNLQSVSLPDSVNSLGTRAFGDCVEMKSIRISGKMDSIGSCTFQNCTSLVTVGNMNGIEEINSCAFRNCVSLKNISFSDKLDKIGWEAFKNCESLGTVLIPRKAEYIAWDAFTGAAGRFIVDASNPNYASTDGMLLNETKDVLIQAPVQMKGNLKIPKGVRRIGEEALINGKYRSVSVPEGVTTISKRQFRDCKNLQTIYLPASMASIQGSYYDTSVLGMINLKRILVPKSNTQYQSIEGVVYSKDGKSMVFYPYGKTGSLSLPDTCKYIGSQMKENKLSSIRISASNKYFTSIHGVLYNLRGTRIRCFPMRKKNYTLPATLRSIDYLNRIKTDLKCESIRVASGNKNFYSKSGVIFEKGSHTLLFYPTKKKGNYKVPVSTRYIASRAFKDAHNLTGLTITKNVKRHGGTTYHFDKCRNLKKIVVQQGKLNYISMNFSRCSQLQKITFPSTIMTTDLNYLPEGVTIHGWKNTEAKESAESSKGKFVSRGTIPNAVTGARVKKIIDKYQLCWKASSEASGYQVYTVYDTIKDLKGAGNTSCYIKDIYEYDTIYIRAYKVVNGKKVYGKARAVNMD